MSRQVGLRHGNPEVGNAHGAVFVDEQVGRLEVAMQHALRVGGGQRGADFAANLNHPLRRQPSHSSDERGEVFAFHQLHREEHFLVCLADVEHPAHARMRDAACQSDLVEDRAARLGVLRERNNFRATGVSSTRSSACQTSPIPPCPSLRHHPVAPGEHESRHESGGLWPFPLGPFPLVPFPLFLVKT
jgi:hypothetical protein